MSRNQSLATRWLGVGLASVVAVVTLGLAFTGRLGLYINPDSSWFAIGMAVVLLVGAVASFLLPLGAEADHGHDHDHGETPGLLRPAQLATAAGGAAATGVVVLCLVTPPASLSAELAMSRDVGAPPLFAGQDVVSLATTGDTAEFGIGEWAAVFATSTNPDAFDGTPVELTGFVTPGGDGIQLTRLVITHCVIDAQPASIPVATTSQFETGQWVTVHGTVRATGSGLAIEAAELTPIDEPSEPYEY